MYWNTVSEGGTIIQFSFSCTSFHSYGNGSAEQIIGRYIAAEKPSKVLSPHILARYHILSMYFAMITSTMAQKVPY